MPTFISPAVIKKVLKKFGLVSQLEAVLPQEAGYRNTIVPFRLRRGEEMALILYKNEPDILRKIRLANRLSGHLASKGWPTRMVWKMDEKDIVQIVHKQKKQYCCVYNYLPGTTISWEGYTKKHLKLLGQVLGLLHQSLAEIEDFSEITISNETANLEAKVIEMSRYFRRMGVRQALEQKLKIKVKNEVFDQQLRLVKTLSRLPHQQPLHLDFVRGNILFTQHEIGQDVQDARFFLANDRRLGISGILDFEKAALGPPVLDLARTLAFLLVDCKYKSPNQVIKHFLHSGYSKRAGQPLPTARLLGALVKLYLTIDFYHFLKHNPYESLEENEHFVKTRLLIAPHLFSSCPHSSTLL